MHRFSFKKSDLFSGHQKHKMKNVIYCWGAVSAQYIRYSKTIAILHLLCSRKSTTSRIYVAYVEIQIRISGETQMYHICKYNILPYVVSFKRQYSFLFEPSSI